jgi:hypothetical protein
MKQRLYLFMASFLVVMLVMGAGHFGSWWGRLFFEDAFAQIPPTIQSVDIKRGVMKYTWVDGPDGPATELRIKCGPNTGQYTFTRIVPVAATGAVDLIDLLPKQGLYYCVIAGATKYGEGPLSSEIPFDAGGVPSGKGTIAISLK